MLHDKCPFLIRFRTHSELLRLLINLVSELCGIGCHFDNTCDRRHCCCTNSRYRSRRHLRTGYHAIFQRFAKLPGLCASAVNLFCKVFRGRRRIVLRFCHIVKALLRVDKLTLEGDILRVRNITGRKRLVDIFLRRFEHFELFGRCFHVL